MATYSFLNCVASLVGSGGNINLGFGAAVSEEGITVEPTEDQNNMMIGADGSVMHNLHAGKSGKVRVRMLKTSPTNQLLAAMFELQRSSSALWGNNVITLRDSARGDVITCQQVAFSRAPTSNYGKDGAMQEWAFDAGIINTLYGSGTA